MIDSNQIGRDQWGCLPCASRWTSAAVAALGLTLTSFLLFFLGSTPAAAQGANCVTGLPVAAPAYSTSNFVTSMAYGAFGGCAGAAGMAFDDAGDMYVVNEADGHLYKFGAAGGFANPATRVTTTAYPLSWCSQELAFSADFSRLYMTRQFCGNAGDVVEISKADGHVIRTVATGMRCATGIAVDPLSGDLFVSSPCPPGGGTDDIYRISNPESATPTVSVFASPGHAQGLAFTQDGTLWATPLHYGTTTRDIVKIAGTLAANPGAVTVLSTALLDAVAVIPQVNENDPGNPDILYVLLGSGGIRTMDLRTLPPTIATVSTGGNAQIAMAAGPDGCLYVDNMDRVYKVAAADGSCNLGLVATAPDSVIKEYYNTGLNHYFITAFDAEKRSVETGGAGPGWQMTGQFITVGGDSPVCRFYGNRNINPATGQPFGPNSHFYTIEPAECAAVRLDPGWTFESGDVFSMIQVTGPGECPEDTRPVRRVYNNRAAQNDSNHRYLTSQALYQQMINSGWRGEGVVFCAQP